MRVRRAVALVGAGCITLAACSNGRDDGSADPPPDSTEVADTAVPTTTDPPTTEAATTEPPSTDAPTTAEPTTTTTPSTTTSPSTTLAPTTTVPETTVPPTEPPTTVPPPPPCMIVVQPGDSLTLIVDRVGDANVSVAGLQVENGIGNADAITAGTTLDTCVGNGIDDLTGQPRPAWSPPPAPPPPPAPAPAGPGAVPASGGSGVSAQQDKLNALFANHGLPALPVDGDSGRLTRQQLCAARLALGLPVSRSDMAAGSGEEQALMAATFLPAPAAAPTGTGRWALIDQTCQIMFVGSGSQVVFVFQTSTGQSEFPTRLQDGARVFRYDSASENGGWHDSIDFPAAEDNPLNGNMYKPLYFDDGQAIHGANSVPTSPESHGCARLRVPSQELLVNWLGLGDVRGAIYDDVGLTVRVQGHY